MGSVLEHCDFFVCTEDVRERLAHFSQRGVGPTAGEERWHEIASLRGGALKILQASCDGSLVTGSPDLSQSAALLRLDLGRNLQ